MRILSILAVLMLSACGQKPKAVTVPAATPDAETRWRTLSAAISKKSGEVIDLKEELAKLNREEEVKCGQRDPIAAWVVIGDVGPRCFDVRIVEQARQAQMRQQVQGPPEAKK